MAEPFTLHDMVYLPESAEMARAVAELHIDSHLPPGIEAYHFRGYACDASFHVVATYRFEGWKEDRRKYACLVKASAAEMVEDPTRAACKMLNAAAQATLDLLEKDKKDAA